MSGTLHVGPRLLLHPHRRDRAVPADARPRGLLPDGLGRQRAADRAPGAARLTASGATRRCPTTPTSPRRRSRTRRSRCRSRGATSSSCASAGRDETEELYESLWRRLGLSVDWTQKYTTISPTSITAAQRAFLRNLARGEAYQAEAPGLWDVTFQTAVAQAELRGARVPRPLPPDRLPLRPTGPVLHRDHPARADPGRAWRWSPTPTTSATRPCSVRRCARPLFGVEVPVLAHHAAEPDKGAGIAMVCTFGDLTDVMWWRELDLPVRSVVGRDGRLLRETPAVAGRRAGRDGVRRAGRQDHLLGARPRWSTCCARPATWTASPRPPSGWPTSTRTATSRWRSSPAGSGTSATAAGTRTCATRSSARGRELQWVPEYMRQRYDNWVGGLNGDWLISRQRFFGVPFPVWYPLDDDGEVDHYATAAAERGPAAGRPGVAGARRLHRGPARPAGRLHPRPRRHGHLGDLVAVAADRLRLGARPGPVRPHLPDGHAAAGARDHPHLAVLDRRPQPLRGRRAAVADRRDLRDRRRPEPQEDVEVQGQRGRPAGRARALRPGRRALAGGRRPARHRQPVRRGADEDRPPAGDQDPQRQQVRPADRGRRGPGARHRAAGPGHARRAGRAWCARRPRRSTPTTTPARSR